jgi:hypothetical protein
VPGMAVAIVKDGKILSVQTFPILGTFKRLASISQEKAQLCSNDRIAEPLEILRAIQDVAQPRAGDAKQERHERDYER